MNYNLSGVRVRFFLNFCTVTLWQSLYKHSFYFQKGEKTFKFDPNREVLDDICRGAHIYGLAS